MVSHRSIEPSIAWYSALLIFLVISTHVKPMLAALATDAANGLLLTPETSALPSGTYIAAGLEATVSLAKLLEEDQSLEIKYLLLSDSTTDELRTQFDNYPDYDGWIDVSANPDSKEYDEVLIQRLQRQRAWRRRWLALNRATRSIIVRASTTIRFLSYMSYVDPRLSDVDSRHEKVLDDEWGRRNRAPYVFSVETFPHLERLTTVLHAFQSTEASLSLFPSLTHVNIVDPLFSSDELWPAISTLQESIPQLDHIRYTGIRRFVKNVPFELVKIQPPRHPSILVDFYQSLFRSTDNTVNPVPDNLTVIVQPRVPPVRRIFEGCVITEGYTSWSGNNLFNKLIKRDDVHLRIPDEADFKTFNHPPPTSSHESRQDVLDDAWDVGYTILPLSYPDVFPVERAISEFIDSVTGGEGEWTVPHQPHEEDFWWTRKTAHDTHTEL